MRKKWLTVWIAFFTVTFGPNAQTLQLSLPDQSAPAGQVVDVPISVTDFNEIVSMQFSIQWDTAVIRYQSFAEADLDNVAIGDLQAPNGVLRLSWFDLDGVGKTLPDGSAAVILKYLVTGEIGATTPVTITDSPLPVQIYRAGAEPGLYDPVDLEQDPGSVTVTGQVTVGIVVGDISCFGAGDGFVDLTVQAQGAYTLSWTGPDFSADTPDISGLSPGAYHLNIADENGDPLYQQDIAIQEPAQLSAEAAVTDPDCSNPGSASISVTGGTSPYQFDLTGTPQQSGVFTGLQPGDYAVTVTDARECTASVTFTVGEGDLPDVDLGGTRALCQGMPVVLSPGAFAAYAWSTGADTPEITVSQPGAYSVTVTDEAGCQASDTVTVTQGEQVELTIESQFHLICPGDSIQVEVAGADQYRWLDPESTLSATDIPDPVAFPQETTTYTVIGMGQCSSDTIAVKVNVFEKMPAGAAPDTCVAYNTPAELRAFGGAFYEWQPAPFPISDPTSPVATVEPSDSATYVVRITDENGCITVDSMVVLVANDPLSSIVAVNMITPNGDGRNDVLEFHGAQKFGPNSLKIYNRWGNLVYQKVNYQNDDDRFDGTFKGQPLPAGNYYYVLSFRTGEIKQKLTIVRE